MEQRYNQVVLVDPTTRNIVGTGMRTGDTPISQLVAYELVANPIEHWIDANGAVQTYTTAQRATRDFPPSYRAQWDNTLMSWVDLRTLDELKVDLCSQVSARRDELQAQDWTWNDGSTDHPMRAGDVFRADISQAVALSDKLQALGQASSLQLKCADGVWRTYTNAQLAQIAIAYSQLWFGYSQSAEQKIAAVMAASTAQDATAAAAW